MERLIKPGMMKIHKKHVVKTISGRLILQTRLMRRGGTRKGQWRNQTNEVKRAMGLLGIEQRRDQ